MSRISLGLYGFAQGWEIGSVVPSYHLSIETPTPLVLGVGVMFTPVTCFVTFVLFGWRLSGNILYRSVLTKSKKSSRPSGSVPTAPPTSHARKLLREFRFLGLLLLLLPSP